MAKSAAATKAAPEPTATPVETIAADPVVEAGEIKAAPPPLAARDDIRGAMRQAPEGLIRGRKGDVDKFDIPDEVIKRFAEAGWSIEWKRHSVFNQEDPSYQVALAENQWQPVTTDEIKGLMPAGHSGAIIRDGLMVMKRPSYLTQEAREEDSAAARNLIRAKEEQLGQTPSGTMTRDHPAARPSVGKSFEPIVVPTD